MNYSKLEIELAYYRHVITHYEHCLLEAITFINKSELK